MAVSRLAGVIALWVAVAAWMALIFMASEQTDLGDTVASSWLRLLFPPWVWEWLFHGTVFGALTAISYAAIRVSRPGSGWQAIVLAIAIAVIYGALDEWHQTFVAGRTGDIRDVGRDAVGAVIVALLAHEATAAAVHLVHGRWTAFGRVTFGTLAVLDGMVAVWLTSLWLVAGPENAFSIGALQRGDFVSSLVQQPAALATGVPFLAVALWIGLGFERSVVRQAVLLEAPTASAFLVLAAPFTVYGLNLVPDRMLVWVATWLAAFAVWGLALPLLLALPRHRLALSQPLDPLRSTLDPVGPPSPD